MQKTISPRRWLILPIDTKERELYGKILLAIIAAEKGWGIIIGSVGGTIRTKQTRLPRGIFIEKSITPSMISRINQAKANGNRVSAWSEEGLIYINRDDYRERRLGQRPFAELDYYFAWGKQEAENIYSIIGHADSKKVVVSGNPRFDLLRQEWRKIFNISAKALHERYGSIILITTKFGLCNNRRGLNGKDYIDHMRSIGKITSQEQERLMYRAVDWERQGFLYFLKLIPVISQYYKNHTIIVRPHPSEDHTPWLEKANELGNVEVVFEGNANEWIMAADVLIHNNCTTGIEAFLLERPNISYQPFKDEAVESALVNKISYQACSEEELIAIVRRIINNEVTVSEATRNNQLDFARKYIANIEGKLACDAIIETIESIDLPFVEGRFPLEQTVKDHVQSIRRTLLRTCQTNVLKRFTQKKTQGITQITQGITLVEMRRLLSEFICISGRFGDIQVMPIDENCFCIYK